MINIKRDSKDQLDAKRPSEVTIDSNMSKKIVFSEENNGVTDAPFSSNDNLIAHSTQFFNKYKECEIWIGDWESRANVSSRKDWRLKGNNGLCKIDPRVRIFLDSEKFGISYSNTYSEGGDIFPEAIGGIVNTATDILESINALKSNTNQVLRVSPFDYPKVWEKTSPIKYSGSLEFGFQFGSSGIFSGLEEVVKPMYAIGSLFAPGDPDGNSWQPPLPTKAQWAAMFLSSAGRAFLGAATGSPTAKDNTTGKVTDESAIGKMSTSGEGGPGKTAIDTAINIQNTYFNAIHSGASAVVKNGGFEYGKYKTLYFQYGRFIIGPCTVGSVKFDFNMELLDENGYPTSGKLVLDNVETYLTAVRQSLYGTVFDGYDGEVMDSESRADKSIF